MKNKRQYYKDHSYIGFWCPKDFKQNCDKHFKQKGISLSKFIRTMLDTHIKDLEKKELETNVHH